jgi:hypothetical protein
MSADSLPSDPASADQARRAIETSPDVVMLSPSIEPGILTQRARLRIRAELCREVASGCGFWDPHLEVVEYHIVPHGPFHSYLESETLRIDVDSRGVAVFVELALSWVKLFRISDLMAPANVSVSGHRFLDFPVGFSAPLVRVNRDNSLLHIQLSGNPTTRHWTNSTGAIWEGDDRGFLTGIWLLGIVSDPSEGRRMAWRAASWRSWRQRHAVGADLRSGKPVRPASTRLTA